MFLRVAGRRCLVVGGGQVAEQKVAALLKAEARVTVISPEATTTIRQLASARTIEYQPRCYTRGDVRGCWLVFAATDDAQVQQRLRSEACDTGVLLNVVDRPELCDFIVPAVMEQGDLVVATSTGGASPALAKRIRRELKESFGPEYAEALQLLRRLRQRLKGRVETAAERERILNALVNSPLLDYLRQRQMRAIDQLLAETAGEGISLASLGMELS